MKRSGQADHSGNVNIYPFIFAYLTELTDLSLIEQI